MKKIVLLSVLLSFLVACGDDDDPKPDPTLNVSKSLVEFEADASEETIDVTSNTVWSAVSAATDWCTVSPASGENNGKIVITVVANPDMEERSTTVTVKSAADNLEKTIEIKQAAASVASLLIGKWELISQTTGDSNWDFILGLKVELKSDQTAIADLNDIEILPGMSIGEVEGNWSVSGQTLTVMISLLEIPVNIVFEMDQITPTAIQCRLSTPGFPLITFPTDGLPIIINKI